MPTTYTSLLGFALPATGELSGTWGDVVNDYITKYVDASVAGVQTISGSQTAVTLSVTNGSTLTSAGSGATGSAQYSIINCTGNPASALTITAPASSRQYIVVNATSTSQPVKLVGAGPTTGVTVPSGRAAFVTWNGSDYVSAHTCVISNDAGATAGPIFDLMRDSASPAASDILGQLLFSGRDSAGNVQTYSYIQAGIEDATSTSEDGNIQFFTVSGGTAAERVRIAGNGDVTITQVDAGATAGPILTLYRNSSSPAASDVLGQLLFTGKDSAGNDQTYSYIQAGIEDATSTSEDGNIQFLTVTNGTASEKMRIDAAGDVGIGTSSPTNILSLGGNSARTFWMERNTTSNTAGNDLTIQSGGATSGATDKNGGNLVLQSGTATGTGSSAITFSTATAGTTGTTDRTVSEKMRITGAGDVGIGTNSPSYRLDVQTPTVVTQARFSATSTGGATILSGGGSQGIWAGGVDYNGTNFIARATTSSQMRTDSGLITFFTDSSLTSGNAFTPTERMRIESNGNVGIGTATPGNARLNVASSGTTSATHAIYAQDVSATILFECRSDGAFSTGRSSLSPYNLTTGNAASVYVDSNGFLYRSTSSLKYKTDVQDATHGLAELLTLRPVTYKSNRADASGSVPNAVYGGLIAEEVHEAGLTEFVQYADDGTPDALAYGHIVSLCIKAIQEQQAIIESLTARIAALEAKGA